MSLVHVVGIDPVAQRMNHAHSAHAQHNLLLQAVVGIPPIQVIGQAAIPARVFLQVRVQQVDRHNVSVAAHQFIAPTAHRDRAPFH